MPTRRDLGEVIHESRSFEAFYRRVLQEYGILDSEPNKNNLSIFHKHYLNRWKKVHRSRARLEHSYSSWLSSEIILSEENKTVTPSNSSGRPKKCFEVAKERTKKKIVKIEADETTTPLSVRVRLLSTRLRRKGNRASSACIKLFGSASPGSSKSLYNKLKQEGRDIEKYSPEEALSLLIEAKLTKRSYNLLRSESKRKGANIYPEYKKLVAAKQQTYPKNIIKEETRCEVPLQYLLNHTGLRILQTIDTENNLEGKFNLICKWGFDGSSGHSRYIAYKQGWKEEGSCDESVFISSFVPLKLEGEGGTAWENPRPSSTRFCRPIRLQFIKETKDVIKAEEAHIKDQIKLLEPFKFEGVEINLILKLTMINGKALCALTDTSTQQCPLCKQTAKGSASWTKSKAIDEAALEFGISPLHAYIRFLEFVLAISYRLDTKTKIRGDGKNLDVQKQKERVLEKLKTKMQLNPDRPKQGYGSTSDGNTARRFFADPDSASNATGIDVEIIRRFAAILFVLSSGKNINIDSFENYCSNTLSLYNEKYSWYQLTPTVHKILAHGGEIIKNSVLPLGQLSEEAQESRNKDIRNFRQFFSRKASRRITIEDLFARLLLSSDPVISSVRPLPKKSTRKVNKVVLRDVRELLLLDDEEENETEEEGGSSEETTGDSEF